MLITRDTRHETSLCVQEIRVITDKIRDDEVSGAAEADWKFAAMVSHIFIIIISIIIIIIIIIIIRCWTDSASSSSLPSRWWRRWRCSPWRPTSSSTDPLLRTLF